MLAAVLAPYLRFGARAAGGGGLRQHEGQTGRRGAAVHVGHVGVDGVGPQGGRGR